MDGETFWMWANRNLNWGVHLKADGTPICRLENMTPGHKGKSAELLRRVYSGIGVTPQLQAKFDEHAAAVRKIREAGLIGDTRNFRANMIMIRTKHGEKYKYYPNYKKNAAKGTGTLQRYATREDLYDLRHSNDWGDAWRNGDGWKNQPLDKILAYLSK